MAAALTLSGSALLAQFNPIGSEIRVNTTTSGFQTLPRAAFAPSGDLVVVWQSSVAGSQATDILAQRYTPAGAPAGAEFRVNATTAGCQRAPDVAMAADGSFVVVWQSEAQDGAGQGVFARRYAADGTPASGEIAVNLTTAGDQQAPRVAYDLSGTAFTVMWESFGQDGNGWGSYARRFNPSGALTGEVQIAGTAVGDQRHPSLTVQPNGDIAVAWESPDGDAAGVFLRRFTSTLTPLGAQLRANGASTGSQTGPALGSDGSGNIVVAWESTGQDGNSSGVFFHRYDRNLTGFGIEQRANGTAAGLQGRPAVAVFLSGDFMIAWEDWNQDQGGGAFARRYDLLGQPAGADLRLNTFQTGVQRRPGLAVARSGALVAIWESLGQDGDGAGVYAQRYLLSGLNFFTLTPCRVFDTRQTSRLASGVPRNFVLAGVCGIPATARAVSVNLTVVGATGYGGVVVYLSDVATPATSNLNFPPSLARANNTVLTLSRDGTGSVTALATVGGSGVDLILDVNGYFQ